jgi:hypothetical protein
MSGSQRFGVLRIINPRTYTDAHDALGGCHIADTTAFYERISRTQSKWPAPETIQTGYICQMTKLLEHNTMTPTALVNLNEGDGIP